MIKPPRREVTIETVSVRDHHVATAMAGSRTPQ
jgi:hypothetical protein